MEPMLISLTAWNERALQQHERSDPARGEVEVTAVFDALIQSPPTTQDQPFRMKCTMTWNASRTPDILPGGRAKWIATKLHSLYSNHGSR